MKFARVAGQSPERAQIDRDCEVELAEGRPPGFDEDHPFGVTMASPGLTIVLEMLVIGCLCVCDCEAEAWFCGR